MSLKGKVALITGGASGLGQAIAKALAGDGSKVLIADHQIEKAQELAEDYKKQGYDSYSIALDVRNAETVETVVKGIIADFGKVDILVNNAGVDRTCSIMDMPVSEWDRIIETNLRGPFLLSKAALTAMSLQNSGYIVNIVSTAAKRAWPNASAYHASKWGLLGFSHALHTEAKAFNVKVTAVICGGMKTPFLLERFPDIDTTSLQDPANVAGLIKLLFYQPPETLIPEIMVLPMKETSWP